MCGIFGLVQTRSATEVEATRGHVSSMLKLSASRGKEAVGLAIAADQLSVHKETTPADRYIKTRAFRSLVDGAVNRFLKDSDEKAISIIGHSRLVTDGGSDLNRNNQPVISQGAVGIHNGIVVNHDDLWEKHDELTREFDVDSEVIFALLRKHLKGSTSLEQACAQVFSEIEGAASIATLFDDRDQVLLATNNGSLYYRCNPGTLLVFASERHILDSFVCQNKEIENRLDGARTVAVVAGQGVVIDTTHVETKTFEFATPGTTETPLVRSVRSVVDSSKISSARPRAVKKPVDLERLLEKHPYQFPDMQRCSRCVLPNTMPWIEFDTDGVCNYCNDYDRIECKGRPALEELIRSNPAPAGRPKCILSVSGGRDSIYGMHYLKAELGLDVISYTYDWGMVTDLARRNISRACGKLGIENILVSADLGHKRDNIRKNVEAWLAKPALGTIPLFMAGDKAYFHFLRKVQKQTGAPLSFLCENLLERTNFKTGFAGVPPQVGNKEHSYSMQASGKVGLAKYFLSEFAQNRKYINSSLFDTASAFVIYYLQARTDHNLFSYVEWKEDEVVPVLLNEYDFELSPDTETTWRIGDGTAAFYNYIYFTIAGFTENDTFRSNQVREGDLSREEALRLVERDNTYRLPSIQWYLETIGTSIPMETVLDTIQSVPKLYSE